MKLLHLTGRFLKPYLGLVIGVIVLQILAVTASLYLPNLNAQIIDHGVLSQNIGYIWTRGGLMLAVSAVQVVCQIGAVFLGARTAMGMAADIRAAVFDRALSFSSQEMSRFGAASLITRTTNDVQQVQMLVVMTLTMMVAAPITMVGGFVMTLREDVPLSMVVLVAVLVLGVALGWLMVRLLPLFTKVQTTTDALIQTIREQITGVRVVRAFGREDHEQHRFDQVNTRLTDLGLSVGRYFSLLFPMLFFVMNASQVAVAWFAAGRIDSGHMSAGQLTAFMVYLVQILMSVMMATFLFFMGPRAAISAGRIDEVLQTPSSVVPPADGITRLGPDGRATGHVRFNNVSFRYPGAEDPVLHDLSFEMVPGQTTAIIGSTGAGKTTITNLIPRLFDATSGSVELDGVDVRAIDEDTLHAAIGLVPQKPYLFSGTVASNLAYGAPDATGEQMWRALQIAQSDDFVRAMDGGLDAPISQGGTNVSGGQRQRLSIARALVKQPPIYVFDDSFSALDVVTDGRLREALGPVTRDASVLIVAQRVSTIRDADQIIVLDDGRIVGQGRHEELLENNPTYAEIVDSQLSAEESAA